MDSSSIKNKITSRLAFGKNPKYDMSSVGLRKFRGNVWQMFRYKKKLKTRIDEIMDFLETRFEIEIDKTEKAKDNFIIDLTYDFWNSKKIKNLTIEDAVITIAGGKATIELSETFKPFNGIAQGHLVQQVVYHLGNSCLKYGKYSTVENVESDKFEDLKRSPGNFITTNNYEIISFRHKPILRLTSIKLYYDYFEKKFKVSFNISRDDKNTNVILYRKKIIWDMSPSSNAEYVPVEVTEFAPNKIKTKVEEAVEEMIKQKVVCESPFVSSYI